jgi:hypothetical protein
LGKEAGMLGTIFRKAQNKLQGPAKLERLSKLIEKEAWLTLPVGIKATGKKVPLVVVDRFIPGISSTFRSAA